MDFYNVLKVAAAKQGNDGATKRYSLAVGPPKKDPKVKGVQSAAVQAFLRRKEDESRQKELKEKRMKEDLLAKRKELKHDKKARAMASRTKDNFKGYNGIPLEEKPRKRGSSPQPDPNASHHTENDEYLTEEEMFEFSQTESEQEEEEVEEPPPPPPKKPKLSGVKKPPPPVMNFAELLRLAEKKQYEPVEIIKPVKKNHERPRTAEEIRELEFLERKNHKGDKSFEKQSKSNSQIVKVSKSSSEKHSSSKVSRSEDQTLKTSSRSKSNHHPHHRDKIQSAEKGTINKKQSDISHRSQKQDSVSHSKVSKVSSHGNSKSSSGKDLGVKQSSSSRSENTNGKLKEAAHSRGSSSGKPPSGGIGHGSVRPSSGSGTSRLSSTGISSSGRSSGGSLPASARPVPSSGSTKSPTTSGSVRPPASSGSSSARPSSASGLVKHPGNSSSSNLSRGGHLTSSTSASRPSNVSGSARPASGTPSLASKPKSIPMGKEPGSSLRPHGGPPLGSSRPSASYAPARPVSISPAVAGSKPKCTVVSETISSKNFVPKSVNGPVNGIRPGQMNGMRPGPPPSGHRLTARPPGPPLPPITSSYKRALEDEEYDSEMEDFIDDTEGPQDEISKHIREIFGYDRSKYKDESDYALRYMESSFREQQKEEARSLRLGIQEDLEEQRREEEELKRKVKLEKSKKMKKR